LLIAKDVVLEALVYILIGLLIGALVPIVLFLCLLALGFTVAGVSVGSLAACCQPPNVVAGSYFSIMQSVGATAKMLVVTPYAAIIGAFGGLCAFIAFKIFEI
jgi:hypothetical protein